MHYFVSCYFNPLEYKSRKKLTKEFIERYPFVILLEIAFPGQDFIFSNYKNVIQYRSNIILWATNWAINKFIQNHWNSLESCTFIDSDVILDDGLVDDIIHVYENTDKPLYLQPYSCTKEEVENGEIVERSGVVYCYKQFKQFSGTFHTGLIYSYNKKFLEIILPFPEKLVLGGFDQYLYFCLFKLDRHIENLYEQIANEEVIDELKQFRSRFNKIKTENYNFLYSCVFTHRHGNKINRGYNTRASLYKNINQEIIKSYFESRKEDD